MKPSAFLVHGFNVSDQGEATVGHLRDTAKRCHYRPTVISYGRLWRLGVRCCNHPLADVLRDVVSPGDVGIGHSNGCTILQIAAEMGAPFQRLIYVNPALDQGRPLPDHVESLDVWANMSDIWPAIAAYIPWSLWGSMGTLGHAKSGIDPRITNHFHTERHGGKLFGQERFTMELEKILLAKSYRCLQPDRITL